MEIDLSSFDWLSGSSKFLSCQWTRTYLNYHASRILWICTLRTSAIFVSKWFSRQNSIAYSKMSSPSNTFKSLLFPFPKSIVSPMTNLHSPFPSSLHDESLWTHVTEGAYFLLKDFSLDEWLLRVCIEPLFTYLSLIDIKCEENVFGFSTF